MATLLNIHPENPQNRMIEKAAQTLRDGGLIAYPTDSCYALGCALDNKAGIERITRIRQLDSKHHFTLMCRDFAQLGQFVIVDNSDFRVIKSMTPGPYTFIMKATKEVPRRMMHAKKHSVGARIPQNVTALALVEAMGEPILSSTLLLPGAEDPLTQADDVVDQIGHDVDVVIESGVPGTVPTSVIDFTGREPEVARVGAGDVSRFE
ncbi:tRNA threonylcarbamoyl adenosine modification protein, Sua5/YciO/YrdC/YwlC family [Brevibacterium sandarakinum]|uniref:tRNA threonylcarbamoyl adenosine modification protein, Sua5/YciO/YrdC/YwlC family n=1 Tax=Brevibacterium sandarakinum TaxID=629680 RepID=A0A1H1WWQ2_BRESA|nr:L-threonylcarbamoyladenylate synthase [Brevibacterium sandarakinum]MDN5636140.1 threonylcarbamoyl-AMP synthase [Brevibacterium sp.]MDN5658352.1 threonylcarbamoyl-AMP synthase [Brevibacterium sandarakinum]SDT00776.1 tRNA threonylcarbamoyl adenosine modification protein, Sua5/YciO/YrdC/YwlC family [Brevibacterium sandarakinum]